MYVNFNFTGNSRGFSQYFKKLDFKVLYLLFDFPEICLQPNKYEKRKNGLYCRFSLYFVYKVTTLLLFSQRSANIVQKPLTVWEDTASARMVLWGMDWIAGVSKLCQARTQTLIIHIVFTQIQTLLFKASSILGIASSIDSFDASAILK